MLFDVEDSTSLRADKEQAETWAQWFPKLAELLDRSGLQGMLSQDAMESSNHRANVNLGRFTGDGVQPDLHKAKGDALELRAFDAT